MVRKCYNTRSRTSAKRSDVDVGATENHQSPTDTVQLAHPEDTTVKEESRRLRLRLWNSRTDQRSSDEMEKPTLLTLLPELQNLIYNFVVVEKDPIHLHVFPAQLEDKKTVWGATTTEGSWRTIKKPSILEVCKTLRKLARPMYFSSNTFSVQRTSINDLEKLRVLRQMWGEDVRHIRDIEYKITAQVEYKCYRYGRNGVTKVEDVPAYIRLKLLENGTLLISCHSGGSNASGDLASGEMCHCTLDELAETFGSKGKDSRRLFDMMAALDHRPRGWAKKCSRCDRPYLGSK